MIETRLHEFDTDFIIASWREVFVTIWRKQTTSAGIEASRRALKALRSAHPGGAALLTIVEASAPMPENAERDALAKVMAEAADLFRASALAFEGSGFKAAAVRGVVTGLTMLARQPYPHKVFPSVDEAAEWLAPKLPGGGAPASRLVQAVDEIRREVERREAS